MLLKVEGGNFAQMIDQTAGILERDRDCDLTFIKMNELPVYAVGISLQLNSSLKEVFDDKYVQM